MTRQGKVLYAQVETAKAYAERLADMKRKQFTGQSVRIFQRTVRANSVDLPVWVVVVREKAKAQS